MNGIQEVLRLYPPESFVAVRLSESVTLGNGAQEREIPKQVGGDERNALYFMFLHLFSDWFQRALCYVRGIVTLSAWGTWNLSVYLYQQSSLWIPRLQELTDNSLNQCEIHVSINAIHRNPVLYPSPSSFDPSRWMKEDTNQDTVNNERIHVKQEKRETHFRRRKGGDVHDASKPIIDHNHDDGPKESFQPFTYLPFFVPPRK